MSACVGKCCVIYYESAGNEGEGGEERSIFISFQSLFVRAACTVVAFQATFSLRAEAATPIVTFN